MVTIVSTPRGVSSPVPLMACPVAMSSWVGRMGISFMPTLKKRSSFFFFYEAQDLIFYLGLVLNETTIDLHVLTKRLLCYSYSKGCK